MIGFAKQHLQGLVLDTSEQTVSKASKNIVSKQKLIRHTPKVMSETNFWVCWAIKQ